MSPTDIRSNLKQLLESLVINDETSDLNQEWSNIHLAVKQTSLQRSIDETDNNMELDMQIDNLLNDLVPQFFKYWSKQNKITKETYLSFMETIKLYHELKARQESGVFTLQELQQFRKQLKKIESQLDLFRPLVDGECYDQAFKLFKSKLQSCFEFLTILETEYNSISSALLPIRNRLVEIKTELDQLLMRKDPFAFNLIQIHELQDDLREIDNARIDGKFINKNEEIVPGQASVINLIETCYDDIVILLIA